MSKHTPGPWAVGFSDGSGLAYITAGDHPALRSTPIVVVSGRVDDWGVQQGVLRHEDARLIATTPKLLELLRETLRPGAYGVGSTLAKRISDAIAEATGEQP